MSSICSDKTEEATSIAILAKLNFQAAAGKYAKEQRTDQANLIAGNNNSMLTDCICTKLHTWIEVVKHMQKQYNFSKVGKSNMY